MNDLQQVNEFLSVTGADFVQRVHELQAYLQSFPADQHVEMPIKHYFAHNTYVREMFSPAGSIVVGKTHRYDHICIVLKGKALVYSEHGSQEVSAPFTFVAPKGSKRLFVVLEDLIFQNVHHVPTTDLDEIERDLIDADGEVQKFRTDHNLEV